jgi:hypothetical protein
VGVRTLPSGNTFWYEDIPQVAALTRKQNLTIETSLIGYTHTLSINNKVFKKFIPDKSPYYIPFVLNPGIYDYTLECGEESTFGAFQISIKEHFWQSWTRALEPAFQDLMVIEGRFKNPINIVLLEITYPPEILKLSNSSYILRNYFQATHQTGLKASFDWFASGLLGTAAIFTTTNYTYVDPQQDYSKLTLQFADSTIARRGFFLQKHDPETITKATWNIATIEDKPVYTTVSRQILNYLSSLTINTNVDPLDTQLFDLLDESLVFLKHFERIDPFKWSLKALNAGKYYIGVKSLENYNSPARVYTSLPPFSDQEIEIDYYPSRTRICVRLKESLKWVMRSVNSEGLVISLNGTGSAVYDITALFLAGYTMWILDVEDTTHYVGPKGLTVIAAEGKITCFFVYPTLTVAASSIGMVKGYAYDNFVPRFNLPLVQASGVSLVGDPADFIDEQEFELPLPGIVSDPLFPAP